MTELRYGFKPGARLFGDPQAVGETLERLRAAYGGLLSPKTVVAQARTDAVLHPYFEWDDTAAARAHRDAQARHLIAALVLVRPASAGGGDAGREKAGNVLSEIPVPIRAYVSLKASDVHAPAYVALDDALDNAHWREQLLTRAQGELQAWFARYDHLLDYVRARDEARALAAALKKPKRKPPPASGATATP